MSTYSPENSPRSTTHAARSNGRRHNQHSRGVVATALGICGVAVAGTAVVVGLAVSGHLGTHDASAATPPSVPAMTSGSPSASTLSTPQPSASVKTLQQELADLNYYSGSIDGLYGPQTAAAVSYLQRDAGLPQTGQMNAATQSALEHFLAHGNSQMNPPAKPSTPTKPSTPSTPQPSASVKTLQQELADLNYYNGSIDGLYGPQTSAAISYLQRDAGLPQTGQMNAATQSALEHFLAHGNSQMNPPAKPSGGTQTPVTPAPPATVSPAVPVTPSGPNVPTAPTAPVNPVTPTAPVNPVTPTTPVNPVTPTNGSQTGTPTTTSGAAANA
jgi:peptidoglycan hydrolase-like protein with peptidoglycan-binding domain